MFDIVGKQERVAVFCFGVFRITMYVVTHAQLGWTTCVQINKQKFSPIEPIRLARSHWPIITGKSENHVSHYGSYTQLITNIPIAMGEMFN